MGVWRAVAGALVVLFPLLGASSGDDPAADTRPRRGGGWPQLGHDLSSTFHNGRSISSAPAIAGDRVYFGSGLSYFTTKSGRTVYALEG